MTASLLTALQEPGNLRVAFQPVFGLAAGPQAVSALRASVLGPAGTHFEKSAVLLHYVQRKQAESFLDRACLSLACDAMLWLPQGIRVHVPVHFCTLAQDDGYVWDFLQQIETRGLQANCFTIDVVESDFEYRALPVESLDQLRQLGVQVGLSDVGFANNSWRLLLERSPEFWSISPYLADSVSEDFKKRAAVESILGLATRLGSSVIATGIERQEDLNALALLGVRFVQAEFLCPPISMEALLRSGAFSAFERDGGAAGI